MQKFLLQIASINATYKFIHSKSFTIIDFIRLNKSLQNSICYRELINISKEFNLKIFIIAIENQNSILLDIAQ